MPAPSWFDVDGDNYDDLVVGTRCGGLRYFKTGLHASDSSKVKNIEARCWTEDSWEKQVATCGAQNKECWDNSETLEDFKACYKADIADLCWLQSHKTWEDALPSCGAQNHACWEASTTLTEFKACYSSKGLAFTRQRGAADPFRVVSDRGAGVVAADLSGKERPPANKRVVMASPSWADVDRDGEEELVVMS